MKNTGKSAKEGKERSLGGIVIKDSLGGACWFAYGGKIFVAKDRLAPGELKTLLGLKD
jgi:hypothetical protein